MNKKVELFLDSGAYSALTQGKVIDIKEYIQFIKDNQDAISIYANLDVIGNAEATWKNQQIMEKEDLTPLPVYHFGEDRKYFHQYLDKYDYICLGGLVGATNDQLTYWLDPLWQIICNTKDNLPSHKIHGFGLTSLSLMLKYPWYSVDSTSWVITGRMGAIFVPRFRSGKWIYDEQSWKINVSNKSPDKEEAGKHISTMSPREKEILLNYIHEKGYKLGKSEFIMVDQNYKPNAEAGEKWFDKPLIDKTAKRKLETVLEPGISNKYQLRDEMNILYFLDLEKSMPEWPWPFKTKETQKGFF